MKKIKKILITGSCGLVGYSAVKYFSSKKYKVFGIDNNMRKFFFGKSGNVNHHLRELSKISNYKHFNTDIRNEKKIDDLIKKIKPDAIIHAAGQPSHDYAAQIPLIDFEVNALGTFYLLNSIKKYCKDSPFIFLSTNKVYGDNPNFLKLKETKTRWDFKNLRRGIDENLSIDNTTHSLFGVSKASADLMVQEFGRYFDMPTCSLRAGCLTGYNQSGVELHGFLNYLIKTNLSEKKYSVFGYKGKQVRDNLHAEDLSNLFEYIIKKPVKGEVFNIGGGKNNSISILESFNLIESISGKKMKYKYFAKNRIGDHICYYTNLDKVHKYYPKWKINFSINKIFQDIYFNYNSAKR